MSKAIYENRVEKEGTDGMDGTDGADIVDSKKWGNVNNVNVKYFSHLLGKQFSHFLKS